NCRRRSLEITLNHQASAAAAAGSGRVSYVDRTTRAYGQRRAAIIGLTKVGGDLNAGDHDRHDSSVGKSYGLGSTGGTDRGSTEAQDRGRNRPGHRGCYRYRHWMRNGHMVG